jgi:general stress protein 26
MGGRYLEKEEVESLLEEARVAVFCSHNRDGTIHAAPVWYRYIDGKIVVLTPGISRKARNVKRDKKVSVLLEQSRPARGVLIYGEAELDTNDPASTAITICEKYMSKKDAESFGEGSVKRGMDLLISVIIRKTVTFSY